MILCTSSSLIWNILAVFAVLYIYTFNAQVNCAELGKIEIQNETEVTTQPSRQTRQDEDGDDGDDGDDGAAGGAGAGGAAQPGAFQTLMQLYSVVPQVLTQLTRISGSVNNALNGTDTPTLPLLIFNQGTQAVQLFQAIQGIAMAANMNNQPGTRPQQSGPPLMQNSVLGQLGGLDPSVLFQFQQNQQRPPPPHFQPQPIPTLSPGKYQSGPPPQQVPNQFAAQQFPALPGILSGTMQAMSSVSNPDYYEEDVVPPGAPSTEPPPTRKPRPSKQPGYKNPPIVTEPVQEYVVGYVKAQGTLGDTDKAPVTPAPGSISQTTAKSLGNGNRNSTGSTEPSGVPNALWNLYKVLPELNAERIQESNVEPPTPKPEGLSNELLHSITFALSNLRGQSEQQVPWTTVTPVVTQKVPELPPSTTQEAVLLSTSTSAPTVRVTSRPPPPVTTRRTPPVTTSPPRFVQSIPFFTHTYANPASSAIRGSSIPSGTFTSPTITATTAPQILTAIPPPPPPPATPAPQILHTIRPVATTLTPLKNSAVLPNLALSPTQSQNTRLTLSKLRLPADNVFDPTKPVYWMNMYYPNGRPVLTQVTTLAPESSSKPRRRRRRSTTTTTALPTTVAESEYYEYEDVTDKIMKRVKKVPKKNST